MNYFEKQEARYKKRVAFNKRLNEARKADRAAKLTLVDRGRAFRNANAKLLTSTKICLKQVS